MSSAVDESPCPSCGEPVHVTASTSAPGEQVAVSNIECPHCGAPLVRAVEGHADRGWQLDEDAESGGTAA